MVTGSNVSAEVVLLMLAEEARNSQVVRDSPLHLTSDNINRTQDDSYCMKNMATCRMTCHIIPISGGIYEESDPSLGERT